MDLDIACRRPLDPLLQFPAWFPEASPLGVNNDLMASRPGHPVLADMTMKLVERDWNLVFPYLTIFWSTGPQFASDVLKEWWWRFGGRRDGHGMYSRCRILEECSTLTSQTDTVSFRILPQIFYSEEFTFFGHSPGGTWHGGDVAVVLWLVEKPWALVCIFGSCLALALGIMKGLRFRRSPCKEVEEGLLHAE